MASLRVTPRTTKRQISEAIGHLRADQLDARTADDYVALQGEIDALLAAWDQAPA